MTALVALAIAVAVVGNLIWATSGRLPKPGDELPPAPEVTAGELEPTCPDSRRD